MIALDAIGRSLNDLVNISEVFLFDEVDSTNNILLSQPILRQWKICIARMQTAGKGRRSNQWKSPLDQQIICSMSRQTTFSYDQLAPLSLVVALALATALRRYGIFIDIKWPNDLWLENKKLGGILIETKVSTTIGVVIGFGINLQSPAVNFAGLSEKVSLEQLSDLYRDLIVEVSDQVQQLEQNGFKYFQEKYQQGMLYHNQMVCYYCDGVLKKGRLIGVDGKGCVAIADDENIHYYHSHQLHTLRSLDDCKSAT